jgi:hypothetical protein
MIGKEISHYRILEQPACSADRLGAGGLVRRSLFIIAEFVE